MNALFFLLALAPADRLEAGWRALHPNQALPAACAHADPVRSVELGRETALASLRFGVVIFDGEGKARASHALGCVEGRGADPRPQVVSLSTARARDDGLDLVVRTRRVAHCGDLTEWTLLARDTLAPLFSVDEEGTRGCGNAAPEKFRATIELPAPGRLRVSQAGRAVEYRLRGGKFLPAD